MESNSESRRSILVIDDDRDFAEGMAAVLKRLGYDADTVFQAEDARGAMAAKPRDIAMVDLKLASRSGLALIADLKNEWPRCLFLLVTAYSSFDSVVEALKVGAYDYLQKPFTVEALRVALRRAVDRLAADEARRVAQEERDQAMDELRQINDRLKFLVSVTRDLTHAHTLPALYDQLLSLFSRSMGAAGGSLYVVREAHLELASTLDDDGHAPRTIPLPMPYKGVFATVLEHGEPVLIQNIREMPNILSSGWDGYCDTSLLAFPLLGKDGRIAAVLSLHSKNLPPFTSTDLDLGSILVGHVQESIRATEAFEALATSERKYRDLAEGSLQGIGVVDGERVLYANDTALSYYGADGLEGLERHLEPFRMLVREQLAQADSGASTQRGSEIRLVEVEVEGHGTRWLEVATKRISWDGAPAVQLAAIDVSSRVRAEERMRAQNRMLVQTEKMAALGTLISGVAHEINNPVNLIGLNVALMERIWADLRGHVADVVAEQELRQVGGLPGAQIPDTMTRLVGGISDAAERITHIVGRLREFSQKSSTDSVEEVDVNAVVQSALELTRRELSDCSANLQLELSEGLPKVRGNRIDLAQVLVNLITNACQALTSTNQTIAIATRSRPADDCVEVAVHDEGRGIAPENLPSIFDPFYTTKQSQGGTGLGLYVCYGIVREHDGRLEYESELGKGTRARLILPCAGPVPQGA